MEVLVVSKLDRLDMLKKLTFIGEKNISIFQSYIPKHYDEIYTLYTLLRKSDIDYNNISFLEPINDDNKFIFVCNMSKKDMSILSNFLKDSNKVKYMRKKSFYVTVSMDTDLTNIIFEKIIGE